MKRISVIMIASLFVIGTTAITQSDPVLSISSFVVRKS